MVNWSAGGKGALTGAGSGAAIGTMVAPGIGTAVGGGAGALAGFLLGGGLDANSAGFGNPYAGAPALTPNPAAYRADTSGLQDSIAAMQQYAQQPGLTLNTADSDAARAQQQMGIDALMARAQGQVPSAAQIQMQQGLNAAAAQSRGLVQSAAALNPIAALQAGSGAQSLMQRQSIGDMAALRANEQANAQNQLQQALSSMRYGDISSQAQQLQTQQFNRQAQLQALDAILGARGTLMNTQLQGNMGYENARMGAAQNAQSNYIQGQATDMQNRRQLNAAILQTLGTAGMAVASGLKGSGATPPGSTPAPGSTPFVPPGTTQPTGALTEDEMAAHYA